MVCIVFTVAPNQCLHKIKGNNKILYFSLYQVYISSEQITYIYIQSENNKLFYTFNDLKSKFETFILTNYKYSIIKHLQN